VALEINGMHPTYNVAPRKGFIKGTQAPLKSLRLALSYVHTQAVRETQPFPDSMRYNVILFVALEINGIHPTYNVAPRKRFIKGARAILKSLRLAISYVHTQAVREP
jgi:hypothetical protein